MILKQTGDLGYIPQRIISLVPSQTELLADLGLENQTIAITKFCVHPATWLKTKERVGGTKTVNLNKIRQLQPDLIIANREENVKEQVEQLASNYPVWLTDINNLQDAWQMIEDIGVLTGTPEKAVSIAGRIRKDFESLHPVLPTLKTAYLIWRKPFMTIGGDTFINDMLLYCGFENVFAHKTRYPEIQIEDLRTANCQLLLLASEPYPFSADHIYELQQSLPGTKIMLADGEMFSWYGSRLLKSVAYFKELIAAI